MRLVSTKAFRIIGLIVVVVLVGSCAAAATPAPTAAPSAAPTAAPSAAPTAAPTEAPTAAPVVGWQPDPNCKSDDPVVTDAIQKTIERTGPQTKWYGPTSGPKPEPGKFIICVPGNGQNVIEKLWCDLIVENASLIGWKAQSIDGKGSAQGWTQALTQAIALKPNVIVNIADAATTKDLNLQAVAQGISVIGIHATAFAKPAPELGLYSNIVSEVTDIGEAEADYIIADSCGKANALVLYDAAYEIARNKSKAMWDRLQECRDCKDLGYVASPIAEISQRMPQLCATWAAQFDKPWYATTIYDGYWDFCVPALKTAGLTPKDAILVASDGTAAAYDRIRNGDFQAATVPEPARQFAFMALDDAIRAVAGEPPAGWSQPIYLVVKQNVDAEGGANGEFVPSNDYVNKYKALWGVQQ